MAYNPIGLGTTDNDNTGEAPKPAGVKINAMFSELYTALSQVTPNTQTASYTAVLADAGKMVRMNVASANNFTIPPNSSVAFPINTVIEIKQVGAGATTVVAGSGVTINKPDTLVLRKQWCAGTLLKTATDTWEAAGDFT